MKAPIRRNPLHLHSFHLQIFRIQCYRRPHRVVCTLQTSQYHHPKHTHLVISLDDRFNSISCSPVSLKLSTCQYSPSSKMAGILPGLLESNFSSLPVYRHHQNYIEKSVHKFVNINYYYYLCPRKVNEV